MMRTYKILLLLPIVLCLFNFLVFSQWVKQPVNTTASLRGLSVVNEKVIWASGTGGTVIKTIDGGVSWKVIKVPDSEKLDFRDIEAFDVNTAYILSIGNGQSSRILKTTDGGVNWKLQFTNNDAKAFFDAIACWDRNNCIAMSDPVDGEYVLISTKDGGTIWKPIVSNQMPAAKDGEAAFAASGTCLMTQGKTNAFIVSGGNDARVFRSTDRGKTWNVSSSPIVKGTAGSGIFSIAMFDNKNGVIVGGNYEKPEENKNNLAFTADGGKTWVAGSGLTGYRSGVTFIDKKTIIAVGTSGSDMSSDVGKTWRDNGDMLVILDQKSPPTASSGKPLQVNLNAVQARGKDAVWAVGANGLVVRLVDIIGLVKLNPF